jgi:hypothetical protein
MQERPLRITGSSELLLSATICIGAASIADRFLRNDTAQKVCDT